MQFGFFSIENACSLRTGISGLCYSWVSQREVCDMLRICYTYMVLMHKIPGRVPRS